MGPDSARDLAEFHLAGAFPRRWAHVQGVGRRAEAVRGRVEDGAILSDAAWLHDIGYAPDLAKLRFHPLDGARAVRSVGGDVRVCGLIAYHSAAVHEAAVLDLADELRTEFSDEESVTRDLLWYLDMTTSPDGETVAFDDRMNEVRARYPEDHYVIRALDASMGERRSAVDRAEAWLAEAGLAAQV